MAELEHKPTKESKLWMVGMISVIIAVVLLVVVAILIQHQELTAETATTNTAQES
jgi:preprotein translocase subunit SecG